MDSVLLRPDGDPAAFSHGFSLHDSVSYEMMRRVEREVAMSKELHGRDAYIARLEHLRDGEPTKMTPPGMPTGIDPSEAMEEEGGEERDKEPEESRTRRLKPNYSVAICGFSG